MRMLLCDTTGMIDAASADQVITNSPLGCMKAVLADPFDGIVIVMGPRKIRERKALVELCCLLKETAKSRNTPLLVLLPAKHRILLEHLHDAGVDFVKIVGRKPLSADQLSRAVHLRNGSSCPLRILKEICPYIHYKEIDARRELAVCAADRCRLVLGPARLGSLCEIPDHAYCPYFKEPNLPMKERMQKAESVHPVHCSGSN